MDQSSGRNRRTQQRTCRKSHQKQNQLLPCKALRSSGIPTGIVATPVTSVREGIWTRVTSFQNPFGSLDLPLSQIPIETSGIIDQLLEIPNYFPQGVLKD